MAADPGSAHNERFNMKYIAYMASTGCLDVNKETRIGALNMRRISFWETGLVVYDVSIKTLAMFVAFICPSGDPT